MNTTPVQKPKITTLTIFIPSVKPQNWDVGQDMSPEPPATWKIGEILGELSL